MAYPEDYPEDVNRWLDAVAPASARLLAVLSVTDGHCGIQRYSITNNIGKQLGLPMDDVVGEGTYLLDRMIPLLEEVLGEGPGDSEDRARSGRIAERVVEGIESLDLLQRAMVQLGWGRDVVRQAEVHDLDDVLRRAIAERLDSCVADMLSHWRKRDAWNPLRGKIASGPVTATSRTPPKR